MFGAALVLSVWLSAPGVASSAPAPPGATAGQWVGAGKLNAARAFTVQALLQDGRMLVAGGVDGVSTLRSAELFDPTTKRWTKTGSMAKPRFTTQAVTLADGRVLVPGGQGRCCKTVDASAEIYDPTAGAWSSAGTMSTPRAFATVTRLRDGRVLVASGVKAIHFSKPDRLTATAEIYDPGNGQWTLTGRLHTAREWASATLLPDGRVLVAGGIGATGQVLSSAETFNPKSGKWSVVASMHHGRAQAGAVLLGDRRVLEVGGHGAGSALDSAELYDPVADSWTSAGTFDGARTSPIVALLKDHTVLVAGGFGDGIDALASADLYTPADGGSGTWGDLPAMPGPRADGVGMRLSDRRVIVAGGFDSEAHDAPVAAFEYVP